MKISPRHKRWRTAGSEGLFDCSACRRGQHETCEFQVFIFCRCWRDKHQPQKKEKPVKTPVVAEDEEDWEEF